MAFYRGPKVVTGDYLFHFDIANSKSYNGGNLYDLSINGDTPTINGSPTFDNDGKGCLSFNGSTDYIWSSTNSYPVNFTDPFTVEVWIYIPSSATWSNGFQGNIIQRGSYGGVHGLIRATTNNTIRAYFRGTTGGTNSSSGTITRDTWHHCALRWDGNTQGALFIDGEIANSSSSALTGQFDTGLQWRIASAEASAGNVGNAFEGKIANVKVYKKSLTSDEIRQNYNALKSRFGL